MTKTKILLQCIVFGFILTFNSCSKTDDTNEEIINPTEVNITSLFEDVIEQEPSSINFGEYELEVVFEETISDSASTSTEPVGGRDSNTEFEPGVLTAGQWSDLNNWDFWNNLLTDEQYEAGVNKWNLKQIKRYSFQVLDSENTFVANAEISLVVNQTPIWKTKTDNKGEATLWSSLDYDDISAIITKGEDTNTINNVIEYTKGINVVNLDKIVTNNKKIDIYFAIDATGSMGDEIDYLKAELSNVIATVKQNNPASEMRVGSVFYRDQGDEYVTKDLSFTSDETSLISFIQEQSAAGGGNFPEAVSEALEVAINQNSWDSTASSKIMFLLLDAPPHYTQEAVSKLEHNLVKAAEEGIKVIPITASGIDKSTEYLMRSFAILTNGTYVFITDDSGIGNSHLEPTIGQYEVQKLNELLINLIGSYIP